MQTLPSSQFGSRFYTVHEAVFCTGNVTLGSASIGSLQQLALVSRGDLSITGAGSASSTLVGLLYSQGNVTLSDVTVVGAVVCAGMSGQALALNNVNALGNPAGVNLTFNVGWSGIGPVNVTPTTGKGGGGVYTLTLTCSPAQLLAANVNPSNISASSFNSSTFCGYFNVTDSSGNQSILTVAEASTLQLNLAGTSASANIKGLLASMTADLNAANTTNLTSRGSLSLNLNKFLQAGDALSVVYREIR